MFERIKAMWSRAWGPFYVESPPTTTVNNLYYPVLHKALQRFVLDGVEYEYWVNANTPWDEPGFVSMGRSPDYDIYRQVGYDKLIGHFDERFEDGNLLLEKLANKVHDIWIGWMRYQSTKGFEGPRGQFTIDAESVARWERQAATPYTGLSEGEKTSDREIARQYLRLIMTGVEKE